MSNNTKKKLIFIELNELNFDVVKEYINEYELNNLKTVLSDIKITSSEEKYELLEPWIQWFSVRTGLKAKDHGIFRLGDAVKSSYEQIYEKIEKKGYSIGAISPMNCPNNCKNPKYFIPDPWTKSKSDSSIASIIVKKLLNQAVNDNAKSKISFFNYFIIIYLVFFYGSIKNFKFYFSYFISSFKYKWRKALFLDLLLNDLHLNLFKKKKPHYSSIFFNAAAHIQHHYFFYSKINKKQINQSNSSLINNDPFKESLFLYDKIIGDYLNLKDCNLIIATGLTQELNEKGENYYRLTDHNNFIQTLGIKFKKIFPRMSRDFLIEFNSKKDLDYAYDFLNELKINDLNIFGELDKRNNSIFVTLTYDKEINEKDAIIHNNNKLYLNKEFTFVSKKNGKHSAKGFCYFKGDINYNNTLSEPLPITNFHDLILNYFD